MRGLGRVWWLVLASAAIAVTVATCRWSGFGAGIALGVAPASGIALATALGFRARGAISAAVGFALGDVLTGLPVSEAVTDAAIHGVAAFLGYRIMRFVAHRNRPETRTREWLVFGTGTALSALTVCVGFVLADMAGIAGTPLHPAAFGALALLFETLGILTAATVLISLKYYRAAPHPLHASIATASIGMLLLGLLWLCMSLPLELIRPSELAILMSVPFALWLSMQPRSLESAVATFVVIHAGLLFILRDVQSVTHPEFVVTILHLSILLATCQFVHAINLDRLTALEESARRKAELEARVTERTARLRGMTERAIAADAAKGKFLATVSHELRTPLNGVIGMAAVLLAGRLAPDARRNIETIHGSGLHLLSVINRILEFARLGHEAPLDESTAFDIADVLTEVVEEARFSPEARGLDIRIEVAPGLPTRRRGDRQRLRQVFTNLIGNALKFTESGRVDVRVSTLGGEWLRGEVQDSGIGIPGDMLSRIFRPFEQADASPTRRYGGMGLGLAICSEIVARMGGRIGVSSEIGAGSIFWLEVPLPVAVDEAPLEAM
jgi:signal transduction histidine kinase